MCLKYVKIATHLTELTMLRVVMTYSYGYGYYLSECCSMRWHYCYYCWDYLGWCWRAMKMYYHHCQLSCDAVFQQHSPFPMHEACFDSRWGTHLHYTHTHKKKRDPMNLFIRFVSIIPSRKKKDFYKKDEFIQRKKIERKETGNMTHTVIFNICKIKCGKYQRNNVRWTLFSGLCSAYDFITLFFSILQEKNELL